jgi:hypothetical protein
MWRAKFLIACKMLIESIYFIVNKYKYVFTSKTFKRIINRESFHDKNTKYIGGGAKAFGWCSGDFGSGVKDLLGGWVNAGGGGGTRNYFVAGCEVGEAGGRQGVAVFSRGEWM